jgi:hypothetical protein
MTLRIPLSLFLLLFALDLTTYSPTLHSSDGQAMFSTAESLVRRGAWDIEQIRWMGLQQGTYGLDGLLYSRKGIGQPILALPLTWLGLMLPWFGPVTTTKLFGSLITALSGVLIFFVLTRLAYRPLTGVLAALVFGTGTLAWPYARTFFSDSPAGLLLLVTLLALITYKQTGQNRYPFIAGLSLAWAVATRYAEGVFLPVFGLLFLAYLFSNLGVNHVQSFRLQFKALIYPILAFAAPIMLVGLGLMAFNAARYGNPLNTGYLPEESFSAIWWQGIAGQLISPGRGLFLYSPILLVSLFGVWPFLKRNRPEALACLAVILIHLLLYGKWFMWHGGFAWGPRFMVATMPFWVILMGPVLARLTAEPKPIWRYGFYALWVISLIVQIPAVSVDFELWQNYLLETGLPIFDPVTFFNPVYSPLWGTWPFITLSNLDVAWNTGAWNIGGQINTALLLLLLLNLTVAAWALLRQLSASPPRMPLVISVLLAGVTTVVLLAQAHRMLPASLAETLDRLNRTDAALIYQNPEIAIPLAEGYKGRGPILGMVALEVGRLEAFTAPLSSVWLVSAFPNDTESRLLTTYGVAHRDMTGNHHLLLLARPDGERRDITATFDGNIHLKAARLSSDLKADRPFAVELRWQVDQTPDTDYHIFIHLTDAGGQTIAQTDGQPLNWTRPTTSWQPGETLADLHAFLPANLPPGPYTLIAGLYLPASGERLPTQNGDPFVVLAEFQVAP